jgi:hypothetical protein
VFHSRAIGVHHVQRTHHARSAHHVPEREHIVPKRKSTRKSAFSFWLRRQGSNLRPSGYRFAPFAVPEKIIGLALILDFFDRCTRLLLAVSATGSARKRPTVKSYEFAEN